MYSYLNTALKAGEIMLRNGSDTYRIQRVMELILSGPEILRSDIIVIGTALIVTVIYKDHDPVTMTRVIDKRMQSLRKLSLVTKVAESVRNGRATLEEADEQLERIDAMQPYTLIQKVLTTSLVSALFTLGFGGTFRAALAIALITLIPSAFMQLSYTRNYPFFLSNIITGGIVSLLSLMVLQFLPLLHFDKMIASVIVIFTPGVMAVTAIRDAVNGDFITGASRGIEAILLAAGLSIGVGAVFTLYVYLTGGVIWTF